MGNLVVATGSMFIPIINYAYVVPYMLHPYRWGGIPWKEPNIFILKGLNAILNVFGISLLGTLGGMMTTQEACGKDDPWLSFRKSYIPVLGYGIGSLLMTIFPVIKAPILSAIQWMPYASFITSGIINFCIILLLNAINHTELREQVCK